MIQLMAAYSEINPKILHPPVLNLKPVYQQLENQLSVQSVSGT